jgi:hypothetical protein
MVRRRLQEKKEMRNEEKGGAMRQAKFKNIECGCAFRFADGQTVLYKVELEKYGITDVNEKYIKGTNALDGKGNAFTIESDRATIQIEGKYIDLDIVELFRHRYRKRPRILCYVDDVVMQILYSYAEDQDLTLSRLVGEIIERFAYSLPKKRRHYEKD